MDPDDAGLFARRLLREGIDESALESLLAPVSAPHDQPPEWERELEDLCVACQAAAHRPTLPEKGQDDPKIAFSDLLQPIVDGNVNQLRGECADLPCWSTPETTGIISTPLLRRLSELCGRAFAEDLADTRPIGATLILRLGAPSPGGHSGSAVYDNWCRRHLESGLRRLLERFPPLGRLMVVACRQWRKNAVDLLRRVHADRAILEDRFGIPREAPLIGIDWELSDPHRGGQRVALLFFGLGNATFRILYKPKDMRIEALFQDVVAEVGRWVGEPFGAGLDIVFRGTDYGYASFIEKRPCANAVELQAFYRNAGRLLALLHVLGATDAHCANLIAAGSSLHLIDAETLFQGRTAPTREHGGTEEPQRLDRMSSSVVRCGMLPIWTLIGKAKTAIDISALGVESPTAPVHAPGWLHVNTDDMVWAEVARRPDPPPSLPVPFGIPNPLAGHVDDLEAGFDEVYRLAMSENHRERLLAAVRAFTGASHRMVLRATRIYAVLQDGALSPEALSDANSRAFALEKLARRSLLDPEKGPSWYVFQAELRDMENLDVPYFEHPLGEETVNASTGPVAGLLAGNGLAEAIERISTLCDSDLAWQKRLIRGSVRARHLEMGRATRAPESPVEARPTDVAADLGSLALNISAELEKAAFDDGEGHRSWLALSLLPDGVHVQLSPIGNGLYDGLAGLTVFWFLLAEACDNPRLRQTAAETLSTLLDRIRKPDEYARFRTIRDSGLGWSGYAGLLRLFQIPWVVRGCAGMIDSAREFDHLLAELPMELIRRDPTYDLLSGVAGLILPIARRHRKCPGDTTARMLREAAAHLVAAQRPDGAWPSAISRQPLAGLSHGASGMGLALIVAGAALSDAALVEAGARAFAYERSVFVEKEGNWPDFRDLPCNRGDQPSFMVSWCHGAPGIGLARLRALEWAPDHPHAEIWREDLAAAMRTTAESPLGNADHLCCGTLGRAAILRIAGQRAEHPEWVSAADAMTRKVAARAHSSGRFTLPNDDPGTTSSSIPGLMNGIAGIGAHLICTKANGNLGALLL